MWPADYFYTSPTRETFTLINLARPIENLTHTFKEVTTKQTLKSFISFEHTKIFKLLN